MFPYTNRTMSQKGLDFLKAKEGFRDTIYRDSGGKQHIGYGHLLTAEDKKLINSAQHQSITREKAEAFLKQDLGDAEYAVNQLVTVPINQNQFDALVSLTFNIGTKALSDSVLLWELNQYKYDQALKEFLMWVKVQDPDTGLLTVNQGLMKRRKQEQEIFIS